MTEQAMKTAAEYQEQARASAALAMKFRLAIINGTLPTYRDRPHSLETCFYVVRINERDSRAFYAAARNAMDEARESADAH